MEEESKKPDSTSSFAASPQKRVFKIIVVGDSCVGKTCLTYRFCEGKFPGRTEATIGVDFREKVVNVEGEGIKVFITFNTITFLSTQTYLLYSSSCGIQVEFLEKIIKKFKLDINSVFLMASWPGKISPLYGASLLQKC